MKYERQKRWRERNPVAAWAHSAVRSAIRRGILTPRSCEVCGDEKAEFHHPNHRLPLHGQWLCRKHHKAEHRRIRCEAAE